MDERLERYAAQLFAAEDAALSRIRTRHAAEGLPDILISADEGKLLHVLLRAVGAARVLEIGTLGGYSGVWLARALPPEGRLVTIERDPRHAAAARTSFAEAGVADRVDLLEGEARELLPTLTGTFDAVFVDADKESLPEYYDWGMRLLRVGGLLLCDNSFFGGAVVDEDDKTAGAEGVRAFNLLAAMDRRIAATILPVRDGVLLGVKVKA